MAIKLYDYQKEAIDKMKNGCILCGGVGSGKSLTALSYYFLQCEGSIDPFYKMKNPKDLYIITTAKKRDTLEWEKDLSRLLLNNKTDKIVIDSWNNIAKYTEIENSFFIFDEQRVIGYGAWTKAFLAITKKNDWVLLSATPGDTWMDYIPVFIANGFYKNKTEFVREHVVYSRGFTKFPKIDRFINEGRLIRLRNKILVDMDYKRKTCLNHIDVFVEYDPYKYKNLFKYRRNPETGEPFINAAELCFELRKVVNSDSSRISKVEEIVANKKCVIIFYSYDYELEILRNGDYGKCEIAEWNGHKHQPVPDSNEWVYLVQYTSGCEGWNCIKTDTIIFYSQSYSYKTMVQASGRIDRLNTPFKDLYYYHLKSRSGIDIAISRALKSKKKFNESRFIEKSQ